MTSTTMTLETNQTRSAMAHCQPAELETISRPLHKQRCAACHRKLGCVARIFGRRYCSSQCDNRYHEAMNAAAVARLFQYQLSLERIDFARPLTPGLAS